MYIVQTDGNLFQSYENWLQSFAWSSARILRKNVFDGSPSPRIPRKKHTSPTPAEKIDLFCAVKTNIFFSDSKLVGNFPETTDFDTVHIGLHPSPNITKMQQNYSFFFAILPFAKKKSVV